MGFVSESPAATHTASDKAESASGGKEKENESEGEDSEDEDEGEEEEEEDEESSDEQEDQEDGEEDVIVVGEASAQDAKEDGKRATSREAAGAPAAKKPQKIKLIRHSSITLPATSPSSAMWIGH